MLTAEEIQKRTSYIKPTEESIDLHSIIRRGVASLMNRIDINVPDSREKSMAITKLEEVMFWANAGIARNHDQ